ncbi:hypothetical protein PS862_04138 [Pseudomonas fluorescens]|uniref:Uncharacterized protein n=1 Tax=Pseudomonas fluorescens TaxID=294 RepID=A0A5E7MQ54_PSEFL|nr:hypothetical protein [Pseudomonas fluorescens]VVP26570.1 hypothetical protein PS862_04138 [Pseudomonas fluorescens]
MDEIEILSLSPGGRYCVQATVWEAGNSHCVYSPHIIDTELDFCLFKFADRRWSLDGDTWLSANLLEVMLRKYPGDRMGTGVRVVIDCARRTALCGEGPEIGLSVLELALEEMLVRGG